MILERGIGNIAQTVSTTCFMSTKVECPELMSSWELDKRFAYKTHKFRIELIL